LDLLGRRDAEHRWNLARRQRTTMDAVAEGVRDRSWLAERLLVLGRALRRTSATAPAETALTLSQPELAGLLREPPPRGGLTIAWGQRAIHRTRVGEVLRVATTSNWRIWYATQAGEAVLPGAGWRVEEGDLPLLLVISNGEGDSMRACLGSAGMVAACLFLSEAEKQP
jgi:hypothetical protein